MSEGLHGFKEWQPVCDALATGRQTILLRKGGIHEGRQGFSFAHRSFFLFPTHFHASGGQLREGAVEAKAEWKAGDLLRVTHHVEAEWAVTSSDWSHVASLEPDHVYTADVVRDRFDWQGMGMTAGSIHVALVRVRELARPWEIEYVPGFGGCRSWVGLPDPPDGWADGWRPVLDDAAFRRIADRLGPVCLPGQAQ